MLFVIVYNMEDTISLFHPVFQMAGAKKRTAGQPYDVAECRRSVRQVQLLSLEEHDPDCIVEDIIMPTSQDDNEECTVSIHTQEVSDCSDTLNASDHIQEAIDNGGLFNQMLATGDIIPPARKQPAAKRGKTPKPVKSKQSGGKRSSRPAATATRADIHQTGDEQEVPSMTQFVALQKSMSEMKDLMKTFAQNIYTENRVTPVQTRPAQTRTEQPRAGRVDINYGLEENDHLMSTVDQHIAEIIGDSNNGVGTYEEVGRPIDITDLGT